MSVLSYLEVLFMHNVKNWLNFLPWREEEKKKQFKRLIQQLVSTTMLQLLFGMLILNSLDKKINTQKKQIELLDEQQIKLKQDTKKIEPLLKKNIKIQNQLAQIEKLIKRNNDILKILHDFMYVVPKEVYFLTTMIDNKSVTLEAVAMTDKGISDLLKQIPKQMGIQGVELLSSKKELSENGDILTVFKLRWPMPY